MTPTPAQQGAELAGVTVFGLTPVEHLDAAIKWLDTRRARLHHEGCSVHRPSAQCNCGLHMALTDIRAARNFFDASAAAPAEPAQERAARDEAMERTDWTITAPDGRQWHGESAVRAAGAAQRDTIDPVLAMQRINAALDEAQAEDEATERDAARYAYLRDWMVKHGLLFCWECTPPKEKTGIWWVLRTPAVINGDSCEGFGKSEDGAIDRAALAQAQPEKGGD